MRNTDILHRSFFTIIQTMIPLYCLQTLGGAMVAVVIRVLGAAMVDVVIRVLNAMSVDVALVKNTLVADVDAIA